MLKLHPRERKPDMVDKIMRAIQLILDTFADYPLGPVITCEPCSNARMVYAAVHSQRLFCNL